MTEATKPWWGPLASPYVLLAHTKPKRNSKKNSKVK